MQLALREVFDWGLVQTDPNFANYRFEPAKQRLQLLDFGATREYSALQRTVLRNLLLACLDGNDEDVAHAASTVGYLNDRDSHDYRTGIVSLLRTATEPVREAVHYTFGDSDLARRMSEIALDLRLRDKFGRLPPPEILFLHRKLAGLYMLLGRLHAKIPTRELITPFLEPVDDKACSTDDL